MANIKSAKKRVLISEANYQRNKSYRSALKTALNKADASIEAKSADAAETVKVAVKKLDQAGAKGIMHRNAVARKKSQLANRLNKAN